MSEKVKEIERRFLLKRLPAFNERKGFLRISQYYVKAEDGLYRNRMTWDPNSLKTTFERIIKTSISEGVNEEQHFPISENDYHEGYANREKYISKVRHIYEYNGLKFEVDEFSALKLVICEIELESLDQELIFPDYIKSELITEITGESEFSNYNLALK